MRRHNGREAIEIGFTDQRISPRAGLWPWADFLHGRGFRQVLEQVLPRRSSPNQIACADLALGYLAGIFSGGTKLAHCAQLRIDPLLPEMLGVKRLGSQSSYSRFFGQFDSARMNSECFGRLWRWGLERLPSHPGGYTLDLDSTHLLHEDARQKEGVRSAYTPKASAGACIRSWG
ncbi:MAG: transposase [Verrucomicrobiota bacterium]